MFEQHKRNCFERLIGFLPVCTLKSITIKKYMNRATHLVFRHPVPVQQHELQLDLKNKISSQILQKDELLPTVTFMIVVSAVSMFESRARYD